MDTKHQVLKALEAQKGQPVSGARLAARLGLSRTAVWKAISALRDEGYTIESQPRRGYMLPEDCDILSEEAIRLHLRHDIPLHLYDVLESTNSTAASLAMAGAPHGTTVIAGEQTAGRGRRGRSFYSPRDTGLYLSIVLEPTCDLTQSVLITAAVAVAVAEAVDTVSGRESRIKWVNDIYLDGRKVSGTLTEALTDFESGRVSHLVTGIGINCTTADFPDSAGPAAGSIGGTLSRSRLAALVIDNVLDQTAHLAQRAFLDEYRRRSLVTGQPINVYRIIGGEPEPAVAVGIDDNAGLIVRYADGRQETLSSGEITIRLR
ncbi:MAG: biotin--[acetyl-CoA-carboxylase] ligase [Anaerovoracaceae bacterium]|jgi:BirA family biotin operon repressor/biotin-[acetyl-CoA-carboxylase] ligase